ncbi:PREDICTED: uncharacterized protein LOC104800964 [Tarenaya hassleriana]|uniref:uncharacterized protein LOC104800964 n=1 Tax=Tarenaya hassleriana TaxID=28532 RepID=UPI00053CA14A|nr:PREDICTED: uncharacterized protein LOC104800964 [Tarenaya hassleriana]
MERGGGSGESSRVVAKTRSSSGCLIVKKKSDGVGRIGSSLGRRRNSQCKKDKNRSRIVASDSESSDEFLAPRRRRVDRETVRVCRNVAGPVKGSSEGNEFGRKRDRPEFDDNGSVRRNGEDMGVSKRNKLDVFEFDEYDGFDSAMVMRKCFDNVNVGVSGRSSVAPRSLDGGSSGSGSGSGSDCVLEGRKKSYINGTRSFSTQEKCTSASDSDSGFDPTEPIRVQGRNGVLKVMVNKKKAIDEPARSLGQVKYSGTKCRSKLHGPCKTSVPAASTIHQKAGFYEKQASSIKAQKRKNISVKSTSGKSSDENDDSASEDSDMSLKLEKRKFESCKSNKRVNSKMEKTLREPVKHIAVKEGKVRRGAGTEKQRLRERIKGMLVDAGWTIDYRPRRNRDYLDAVYINPSGTAYWSIIKAYEALLKQLDDDENDSKYGKDVAAFASVSEDIMNKLARKTKNITRTGMMKKWQKETSSSDSEKEIDGEERTTYSDTHEEKSFLVKSVGKSTKKRVNGKINVVSLHSKSENSSYHNDERPSTGLDSHYQNGRKSNKLGRCTLLVRSSRDEKNLEIDGFSTYSGKRTLLSWLIDSGVVQQSQKVQYMNRRCTKVMLEGWITRDGIHCKLCFLSRFEIHAGSKLRQPFPNIYLDSGVSLLQCQINAWNMQEDAENLGFHHVDTDGDDPNDDTCGICGDGGDLICCDGCPSTYHQSCLGMQSLPSGDWHCPNCTCKFCGAAVDSNDKDESVLSLLSCNMCEKKYHQQCMNEMDAQKVQYVGSTPFCGPKCLELFEQLQKYLGVKNELEAGFSWSLIHRVDTDSDSNPHMLAQRIEINSKLAVGLAIMDECFLPIVDRRSGVNLIRNVLYNCGSNFNRINYTGFYTAILERGDEIISAASLRFHGTQLAEMPFIGTRHIYRRQGMCRRLFDAIELAMRSLRVEKLVIPAIPDFLHAWICNFGFSPLEDSSKKEMRSLNTLVFPGIDMLQKSLLVEGNAATAAAGVRQLEDIGEHLVVHDRAIKSEMETGKKSGCDSSAKVVPIYHKVDDKCDGRPADKDLVTCDEDKIPASAQMTMSTISKQEDELPNHSPGGESRSSSSACQIALNSENKNMPGFPCEDTGSSCEDGRLDVNAETDAQELLQASADKKTCADSGDGNNIPLSNSCGGSSNMSSIIPDGKSEQLPILLVDGTHSCKVNNLLSNVCPPCEDQAASRLGSDEKPPSGKQSGPEKQFGSDGQHTPGKGPGNEEFTASELGFCDIEAVQSSKVYMENGHEANGCLDLTGNSSSVDKLADSALTASFKENGSQKDDLLAAPAPLPRETIAE